MPQPGSERESSAGLITVLTYGMGAGPFAMYALSVLSPLIVRELELGHAQYGIIASIGFIIATIASVGFRGLVDRVPSLVAMYMIAFTSSMALLLIAIASSFSMLILAVVFAGICLSLSTPATNRILSLHIVQRRGMVMGIKQSGVQVSQVLASLLFPVLAIFVGWRWSATVGIAIGCLGAALAWRYVPRDVRINRLTSSGPKIKLRQTGPLVWWLAAYSFAIGAGIQATNVHLPLFAHDALGLSVALAGVTTAIGGSVGVVSRIFWGRASEGMLSPALLLAGMTVLSVGAGLLILGSAITEMVPMLWIGIAVFGASALASNAVVMMTLMQEVDGGSIGSASAIAAAGLYLGFATGPFGFGLLVETSGSYPLAWGMVTAMYATSLLIVTSWLVTRRRASLSA